MAGDVHGAGKALARAVDHAAVQVGGRRKGDGVQHEVEPPPLRTDGVEHCLQLAGLLHVQRHLDAGLQPLGERLHMGPGLVVEPGDGEVCASGVKGARAAPGDALFVGNADHQALLALQDCSHRHFSSTYSPGASASAL